MGRKRQPAMFRLVYLSKVYPTCCCQAGLRLCWTHLRARPACQQQGLIMMDVKQELVMGLSM